MKMQKNKILGGGGVDRALSTSNNEQNNNLHVNSKSQRGFTKKINNNNYQITTFCITNEFKFNAKIQNRNNIMRSTILLLSWLFVAITSLMLICFSCENSIKSRQLSNNSVLASGTAPIYNSTYLAYEIKNENNLLYLSTTTDSDWLSYSYIQTDNIEISNSTWIPIGVDYENAFTGSYDGQGHTITFKNTGGVTVPKLSNSDNVFAGLFGCISNSMIKNIGVNWEYGVNSTARYIICGGGIVGFAKNSIIECCYVAGTISYNGEYGMTFAGGIAGHVGGTPSTYSIISDPNDNSKIKNCYSRSNVTGSELSSNAYAGGIVACIEDGVTITNCYNTGKITANAYEDGGSGYSAGIVTDANRIYNCFSLVGEQNAPSYTSAGPYGSASGISPKGTPSKCYYDYPISNGGIGTRLATNSLSTLVKDKDSYSNSSNWNTATEYAWDFKKIWRIDTSTTSPINDGLPFLSVFYKYTLTFDIATNGGTETVPQSQNIEIGESISLPSGEYKSGWTFVGWSENASATTSGILTSPYTPTNNVTLYAIFKKDISATFYQINGTSEEKSATIYNNETTGNIITPNINVGSNETAVGWSSTNSSSTAQTAQGSTLEISGGEKYYAVVSYVVTITYSGNGATSGQMNNSKGTAVKTANGNSIPNITQYANITIAPNSYNKDNYEFLGWSKNSNSETFEYESNKSYNFDSDVTLFAIWKSNFVNIKINITTNVGAIFYIYDNENNFVQQMFVDKNSDMQILNTNLLSGGTYKIVISSVYTANINQVEGATKIANNALSFVVTENGEIKFTLFGYCGNNTVII